MIKYDEIPPMFIKALVIFEDKRFWRHHGVDIIAVCRAIYRNIFIHLKERDGIIEGASTITQQAMRAVFFDGRKREETWRKYIARKLKVIIISLLVELLLNKKRIMEIYANNVYFGWDAYGLKNASLKVFGKMIDELNDREAIFLAGLPKSPFQWGMNEEDLIKYENRENVILLRMVKSKWIDRDRYIEIKNMPRRVNIIK